MSDAVIARLRYWLEHGQPVKSQISIADVRAIIAAHDSRAAPKDERHPESYCHRCGNPNVVWFAPNDIWNRVMPDDGIVCPVCFVLAAESAGIVPTGWALLPEDRLAADPTPAAPDQAEGPDENRGDDVPSVTSRAEESVIDKGVFRYDTDKTRLGAPSTPWDPSHREIL